MYLNKMYLIDKSIGMLNLSMLVRLGICYKDKDNIVISLESASAAGKGSYCVYTSDAEF